MFFSFGKSIETRKDRVWPGGEIEFSFQKLLGDTPMEHPFERTACFQQERAKACVDLGKCPPKADELLLVMRLMLVKISPKVIEKSSLFIREVIEAGVEFLLMTQVLEQMTRLDHVLVRFVEVAQEHFAPEVEMFQTFTPILFILRPVYNS